jgi:hypothetical protein
MEDTDLQFYMCVNLGIVGNGLKSEQENGSTPAKLVLSMGKTRKND